jgi:hypothetical protein
LPAPLVDVIVENLRSASRELRSIIVPCSYLNDTATTIDFTFGQETLRIPIQKLILQMYPQSCHLAMYDSDDEMVVLGGESAIDFNHFSKLY